MHTIQIEGVSPPPFDKVIDAFGKGRTAYPHPAHILRLAVLNHEGVLYRVIEVDSVNTAIALLNTLAPHNVWDRIKLCDRTFDPIDLLTGERYTGQYDGVLQTGIEAHPLPH